MKPPTPKNEFEIATCLLTDMHVETVLADTNHALTPAEIDWFKKHVDLRIRYLHANNRSFRKWLNNEDRRIDPRDQLRVWIRHWLTGYLQDTELYQQRYTLDDMERTTGSL